MSDINFYDTAAPGQVIDDYEIPYGHFSKVGFASFQLLEIAFRALMGSGLKRDMKTRGETLLFGGYYYETLVNVAGRNLDEELRETGDLTKFISLANQITEKVFKKTDQELGYTRIGIIKLERLDKALAKYNEFMKNFDSSSKEISPSDKKDLIEKYKKSLIGALEVNGRSLDELVQFVDDEMIINPSLMAYFGDYVLASDIYWGYVLSRLKPERKLHPINDFIRKKIIHEHSGNEYDSIKMNKTFCDKYFSIKRIQKRVEAGRKSELYQARLEYFLDGPLGRNFIDQVLKLSKENEKLFNTIRMNDKWAF